jgi:hypothetical protein
MDNHSPLPITRTNAHGALSSRKRTEPIQCIVIHHTATKSPEQTVSALRRQGFSTHYEIDQRGAIYQYIEHDRVAFHAGMRNGISIGIDLTHATGAAFPDGQIRALGALLKQLCAAHDIPLTAAPPKAQYYEWRKGANGESWLRYLPLPVDTYGIYRHSNCGPTRCPDGADVEAAIAYAVDAGHHQCAMADIKLQKGDAGASLTLSKKALERSAKDE